MWKKVLICWLGRQWRKYVTYFSQRWYFICWVTASWVSSIEEVQEIISYKAFLEETKKDSTYLDKFSYVIIAVKPYEEQDKVIDVIISCGTLTNIIIEKPYSLDWDMLEKLCFKNNVFFFYQEVWLAMKMSNFFFRDICFYSPKKDYDIFQHGIWLLIIQDNFQVILKKLTHKDLDSKEYWILRYVMTFWKFMIRCEWDKYFINSKEIQVSFDTCFSVFLKYISNSIPMSQRIKKNTLLAYKYFHYGPE